VQFLRAATDANTHRPDSAPEKNGYAIARVLTLMVA
jgi:hypothetical protein